MKINPNIALLVSLLSVSLVRYIFESSALSYALISLTIILILLNYAKTGVGSGYNSKILGATLSVVPLSIYLSIASVIATIFFRIDFDSIIFFYALTLPFIGIATLKTLKTNENFVIKLITYYIYIEFFIVIGQLMNYIVGFGLPIPKSYGLSGMVTGTQYNSNNLAAILLPVTLCVAFLNNKLSAQKSFILWAILFFMQILLASKASILLTSLIYISTRRFTVKNIIAVIGFVFSAIVSFTYLLNYGSTSGILGRISVRMNDLIALLSFWETKNGESISERTESYFYFLDHYISRLQFGSLDFGNYDYFFQDGMSAHDLFKTNPHSLLIELAYYAGWAGLLFSIIAFMGIFLYYNSGKFKSKLLIIFCFLVASFIPSTLIGNFTFLVFFALSLTISNQNKIIKNI